MGSVRRKGGFSWATPDERTYGDGDPRRLGSLVVEALNSARRVALAFECPLAVPIPSVLGESWTELGRARQGEGNRSWSAGAGTGALATGLVQLAWLCRYLVEHCRASPRVTTQLDYFTAGKADLLIAEAMVTSEGKPEPVNRLQDHADAVAAAKRAQEMLGGPGGDEPSSDVSCAPHVALNLAAAAAIHAGMNIDESELRKDITVAKAKPIITD